jgi:hypothetical protein
MNARAAGVRQTAASRADVRSRGSIWTVEDDNGIPRAGEHRRQASHAVLSTPFWSTPFWSTRFPKVAVLASSDTRMIPKSNRRDTT